MNATPPSEPYQPRRRLDPAHIDPYRTDVKPPGAVVCEDCGLVHHAGRWYVGLPPLGDDVAGVCPACRRIRDGYPAGTLRLHGVPDALRREVRGLIRNAADHERREHPLERVMAIEEEAGAESGLPTMVVTTTGQHVARCIANALERRFHGGITIRYADSESLVNVDWAAG